MSSQHTRFTRCPHIPLPLAVTCVAVIGRKSELLGGLARRNSCGGKFCAESELECSRRVSLSCPVPQWLAEGARLADPPAPMAQRLTVLLMGVNGRVSMRHACGSAASPLCVAAWRPSSSASIIDSISNRVRVFGALGARRSLQGLLAAAEPLQMPLRCLRPKGASGCARAAALGGGGRATLSAAIATYGDAIDFGRFLALKLRVVTISKKDCRSEN